MPLHRPHKPLLRQADCLDETVLRPGHLGQAGRQGLHRLVVVAVHADVLRPQQLRQGGAGLEGHGVYRSVVGRGHMVLGLGGVLGGQVLVEGAAQDGVEKLNAPADAQDGQVPFQSQVQQRLLHPIPRRTDLAAGGFGRLSVQSR